MLFGEPDKSVGRPCARRHLIAVVLKHLRAAFADVLLIVEDQHPSFHHGYSRGSLIMNVVPLRTSLSTSMVPLCLSMMP